MSGKGFLLTLYKRGSTATLKNLIKGMIKMIIKAITKEYHSKLIVRIDAPRKAKMKA